MSGIVLCNLTHAHGTVSIQSRRESDILQSTMPLTILILERLSGEDWNASHECGFNPKLSPAQVVEKVKAAYGELTEQRPYGSVEGD
eukprot:1246091-Amphidinium_carterae.2